LANESDDLDPCDGDSRPGDFGIVIPVFGRLREGVKGTSMLILTASIAILLFIYLVAALLRPEWF
jgi:K+-transporting ATPase KdpF subunit